MLTAGDQVVDQEEEKHETERLAGSHGGAEYGQVGLLGFVKHQAWMVKTGTNIKHQIDIETRHCSATLFSFLYNEDL